MNKIKFNYSKVLSFLLSILIICFCLPIFSSCLSSEDFITKLSKNKNEYNLTVDIDCENKTLDVKQKIEYINSTEDVALNSVYFHIYPKAFGEGVLNKPVSNINENKAYPNGVSYGEINITKVEVNEKEVSPEYLNADKDILAIKLEEELLPKKNTEFYFEYTLKLPNIHHRYGYGENTINLGNFYLIACVYDEGEGFFANSYHYNGDPFYSDIANYNAMVSYDENYTLAYTGYKTDEKIENGKKTTNIKAEAVRDFALILSNKYKVLTETINNTKVNYFYYNDNKPEQSLQASVDSVKTFNELFSEYPYKELNVCESNFVYGGMEYPNLVFISDNLDNYEDYIYTIVHEIGHQWWYSLVGNNEYKYGFLDEGLTEYSTYLFFDKNPQYNMDKSEMIKNTTNSYLLFIDVYEEVFGTVDTSMLRSLNEYNTEPEYIYMAYVKGVLMFDHLKELVGEKKFIKSLQIYYNNNKGKNATPSDLINAFNKGCGDNLENYFNAWFKGSVVIETI